MKNLTCDVCGTDKMVNTYELPRDILITSATFAVYTSAIYYNPPIDVEVCNTCAYTVRQNFKEFLVKNKLMKGK